MFFPKKKKNISTSRCGDPPLGGHHHCGRLFAPRYSWSCRFLRNQPTGSDRPMTPLHGLNPSCARWRNGKKKTSSLTQQSIGFISFYIEIPSICWRIDIFQHLRLSVFFSKIQLSRNVDWQCTWNLLVKYGCVMEDFNVIVSKEFCALAAMLLPTVWGATPSEERCWKKFGKDLGGYCTTHNQCQPGINKPPKLGGGGGLN